MVILLFILIAVIIVFFLYRAYKNTKDIVINNVKLGNQKQQKKLRILHLSDLHLENISISPNELYKKLKGERIDLIALTGDFLDRKRTIPKLEPYLKVLNKLEASYGIYAVLGNHDYVLKGENLNKLVKTLTENNCKVLRNEHVELFIHDNRVNIIGIDDFSTKRSNLKESFSGIKPGFQLVLTHDPNIVLHMKEYHFDYLLAGHFHGGQICYPKAYHLVKMGKLVRMNMIKGLQQYDKKTFYISEGLGQTGINIRVGSRPEITFHDCQLNSQLNENELLSS